MWSSAHTGSDADNPVERHLSHGCIRVQKPSDLAAWALSVELKGESANDSGNQHKQCGIDFVLKQNEQRTNGDGRRIRAGNGPTGKGETTGQQ